MGAVIAGLIARYGSAVMLRSGETALEAVALLQPLHHRGWSSTLRDWTPLGSQAPGQFLLLTSQCPAGYDLVDRGGERFWLRRWEPYEIDGTVLYYWAVLTKEA